MTIFHVNSHEDDFLPDCYVTQLYIISCDLKTTHTFFAKLCNEAFGKQKVWLGKLFAMMIL